MIEWTKEEFMAMLREEGATKERLMEMIWRKRPQDRLDEKSMREVTRQMVLEGWL